MLNLGGSSMLLRFWIFSPPSWRVTLHIFPSIPLLLLLQCERERERSHIRLYTVAWRHAFWFIDLKWPPCCDCCSGLDGEWGCQGVGVRLPRIADLFLDIVFSSHEMSSTLEGLLLQWFGYDDWLIRPWCTKLHACVGWFTTMLLDIGRQKGFFCVQQHTMCTVVWFVDIGSFLQGD